MTAAVARRWSPLRHTVPFAIGGICIWLLLQQLDPESLTGILPALAVIPITTWLGAILATALSFWALGRYDVILHRHLGTGLPDRSVAMSGASAIALGQVLGIGVVIGAVARWRILPGLSPVLATKIAFLVAVSFLVCLAGLVGMAGLVLGTALVPLWIAALLTLAVAAVVLLCAFQSLIRVRSRRIALPSLPAIGQLIGLTVLDTAAAALALYLLLPAGAPLDWPLLYTAYLLALFGALITGTPGGVGPFELILLACLPSLPEPELLASIVAFRLVYYALPAALAAVPLLAFPLRVAAKPAPSSRPVRPEDLSSIKRSELGVCRQNGAQVLSAQGSRLAVVKTPHTLAGLFDPLERPSPGLFHTLARQARQQNRVVVMYKSSSRIAVEARRSGWVAAHIADEAVLNPLIFSTKGAAFRQLRRKLRQAQAAGVTVERPSGFILAPRSCGWIRTGKPGKAQHGGCPWGSTARVTCSINGFTSPGKALTLLGLSVSTSRSTSCALT